MDENDFIKKYLEPLSKNFKDAINLSDDAAILEQCKDKNYIVSTDNFISGVHCPRWINVKFAVIRAVLIAVSDLSAMAVKPYCIFLSLSFPKGKNRNFFNDLKNGIKQSLSLTNMKLAGGDICTYDGPETFCVTVVGVRKKKYILKRSGVNPGEKLCVTGSIGDAKIGLDKLLKKKKITGKLLLNNSIKKFLFPPIMLKFAQQISEYATSCIDISDGLMSDVAKLAKNSKCALNVNSDKIPLSMSAFSEIKNNNYTLKQLISAGDDYELAFSIKDSYLNVVKKIAKKNNIKLSIIGNFYKGKGTYLDKKAFEEGYTHL